MNRVKKNRATKSLTVGYIRNSVDQQVVMNQKLEIFEYCRTHKFSIDKWIESETSPHRSLNQKRIAELLSLSKGDILISTEISRLGRSTSEVLGIVDQILKKGIRIIFTKQDLDLDLVTQNNIVTEKVLVIFSVLSKMEKDIISLRTKEILSIKRKHGSNIGKAKGTIQNSIYDTKKEQILLLLSKKISILDISRVIGIGKPRSLLIYLNKRKLREEKKLKNKKQKQTEK